MGDACRAPGWVSQGPSNVYLLRGVLAVGDALAVQILLDLGADLEWLAPASDAIALTSGDVGVADPAVTSRGTAWGPNRGRQPSTGRFQAEGDDHASAAAEDVGDDDLATVGNGDLSGDGQTESGGAAAAFAAVVKADEPTEHPFSVSSRDTGTVVGHLDPNTVPATTPGVGGFCVEFRDGGAIGVGMFSAASASNSIRQVAPRPTANP
ncbi:MAG: hypothetical protein QOI69_2399 [Pseudonocardiales bacterium]|nr:hypothetical protein [Pseudonocardiales bacterium]